MSSKNDGVMLVTYSSLDDAANTIEAQAKRLDQALEDIQTKIRSVSNTWEGEAKIAADGAHAKWDKETRAIHTALQGISKAVRQASPAYQAGDKRAAGFF
ncbi:WXG100 family type VII secretion target [Streptomyces sp. NPDC090109]|uniref:WXG100 family type VII secretion target n=1 Tax=Streptomyces TaxID=1883 RepID=UPI000EF76CD5|nr:MULTISPECIES: WXG100 family type VII secretion target [unclassified Streptomyces]MZE55283.1 WXG100 family type VII secretion target [Streptomyces sp. SID5770]